MSFPAASAKQGLTDGGPRLGPMLSRATDTPPIPLALQRI